MRPVRIITALAALAAPAMAMTPLIACGSSPPAEAPKKPAAKPAKPKSIPKGHLDRKQLELVLMVGPGWVYEHVPIEEVLEKGKFVGWRIQSVPLEWGDVELRPGDVVTAVNTMPVQKPDQWWAVWTTLSVASELKIAYLRDGQEQELSVPIHGQPDPRLAQQMQASGGGPGKGSRTIGKGSGSGAKPGKTKGAGKEGTRRPPSPEEPKRKQTIVIESHEKPYNEGW